MPRGVLWGLEVSVPGPIERLAETPDWLSALVSECSEAAFFWVPGPGRWAPAEVLGHLVDAEWAFGFHLRAVWAGDARAMAGVAASFSAEDWVASTPLADRHPHEDVAAFRSLRSLNLLRLQAAGPRSRAVESLLETQAEHDQVHVHQLARTLDEAIAADGGFPG